MVPKEYFDNEALEYDRNDGDDSFECGGNASKEEDDVDVSIEMSPTLFAYIEVAT